MTEALNTVVVEEVLFVVAAAADYMAMSRLMVAADILPAAGTVPLKVAMCTPSLEAY